MYSKTSRPSRNSSTSGRPSRFSNRPARGGNSSAGGRSFSGGRPQRHGGGGGFRNNGGRPSFGGGRRGGGRKMPTFDPSRFINTNPVDLVQEDYVSKNSFADFGVDKKLTKTITDMGLITPSPIQDQIIPLIMEGKDVIGIAETGTGKTAAFLIPIIEKTLKNPNEQTLILAPTRELAIQIADELRKLSRGFQIFGAVCVGGVNIQPQIRTLKHKNHFVIGTPGRVLDLINKKYLRTKEITNVVLDEADRMLDMGFINDMRKILSTVRPDRQTLFFSATMTNEARQLVKDFMKSPVEVSVKKKDVTNSIEQDIVRYAHNNKYEKLLEILKEPGSKRVLIFGSMKHSVERLSKELTQNGIKADSIHGNKNHGQRQRALTRFKTGEATVLVATDVAARGIHVDDVTHVINYDLPNTFDDYVHRIGRTGRGTKKGKALTFVMGVA